MSQAPERPVCEAEAANLVGRDLLRKMQQEMQRIRRFEERAAREYAAGRISGFCHLYIGEEGVAVGALAATRPSDHVITAYRDHGHALLRGCTPRGVMAELFGKVTGVSHGRGGSMHLFAPEAGFHGGHGIVGAHIPLATGFGFASAYREKDDVTLCFFGEGAINQGAFYESLNLASLWKLPVVYICENNEYAMGTPLHRASAISDLYQKAEAFGMPGEVLDGMDVCATHRGVKEAIDRARVQRTPTLIEARCYRFRGHSMSDPAKYRTVDEVEKRRGNDPLVLAANTLLARGWATEAEIEAWDEEAKRAAVDAAEYALASPLPDLKDLDAYVYADPLGWRPDEATTPHERK
jgi:pyruvate dehydrogenase E1 component alpha subunit